MRFLFISRPGKGWFYAPLAAGPAAREPNQTMSYAPDPLIVLVLLLA